MADTIIRPSNGVLLFALQSAEDSFVTLDPLVHAIPYEEDSVRWNSPTRMEASNEVTNSFVGGAPLIVGQPSTISFRSRIKGAGAGVTYTSSVKPPLHAPLAACGRRPQFTAAIAAAALTAGSTTSATLGTGFAGTAQAYRGMPLLLTGTAGAGMVPLISDYSAGKVATLADLAGAPLTTGTLAALPANWTYAGTTPADASARATDHPCATIGYFEDGVFYQWGNVRGTLDMEGDNARPGYATFNFTGVFISKTDAAVPTNAVIAGHSAPVLLQGNAVSAAIVANRKPIPISKWSLEAGGVAESGDDPNSLAGFQSGQLSGRTPMFKADPLSTLVATRNALAEIAAFTQYPIALRFGATQGNRWSLLLPQAQAVDIDPTQMRGKQRAEQLSYQALNPGRDAVGRDAESVIAFY